MEKRKKCLRLRKVFLPFWRGNNKRCYHVKCDISAFNAICFSLMLTILIDGNYSFNIKMKHQINLVIFLTFVSGICIGEGIIVLTCLHHKICQKKNITNETGIINSTFSSSGLTYQGPYVPPHILPNLNWYECNGLMRYIDKVKYFFSYGYTNTFPKNVILKIKISYNNHQVQYKLTYLSKMKNKITQI